MMSGSWSRTASLWTRPVMTIMRLGLERGTAAEGEVEEEFGVALTAEGPEARSSITSRDNSVESLEFV